MEVPLNILHDYIGIPILLGISIDAFHRKRKNNNSISLYLGWACLFAAIAASCFGLPVLFTHDSRLLGIGTLVGDYSFALSMVFFWMICFKAFLANKPALRNFALFLLVGVTLAICIEAIFRNLTPPYGAHVTYGSNGRIALDYKDTLFFTIFNAIDSAVLLIIGVLFWRQGKDAATRGQRLRIKGSAVSFLVFAAAYIVTPVFGLEKQAQASFILLSAGLIIFGGTNLLGATIDRATNVPNQPTS